MLSYHPLRYQKKMISWDFFSCSNRKDWKRKHEIFLFYSCPSFMIRIMMSSALFSPRSLSKTEEIKEKLLYCHCIFVERMGFQALFSHSKGKMWKKDKKIYLFFNLIHWKIRNSLQLYSCSQKEEMKKERYINTYKTKQEITT